MLLLILRLVWETIFFVVKLPLRLFWVAQEFAGISYASRAYEGYLAAYGNPLPDARCLKTAIALRAATQAQEKYNEVVTVRGTQGYPGNLWAGLKIMSLLFLLTAVSSMFSEYAWPTLTRQLWQPLVAKQPIPAQWIEWACWNSAHWINQVTKSRSYADRVSPARARPDMAYLTPAGVLISEQTHQEIQYRPGLHILDSCGGEFSHEELSTAVKTKVVRAR